MGINTTLGIDCSYFFEIFILGDTQVSIQSVKSKKQNVFDNQTGKMK